MTSPTDRPTIVQETDMELAQLMHPPCPAIAALKQAIELVGSAKFEHPKDATKIVVTVTFE